MEHTYEPSGWCACGHHRDDGRRDRDRPEQLTIAEIRTILDSHYTNRDTP